MPKFMFLLGALLATNLPSTNGGVHSYEEKCDEQKNVTTTSANNGATTLDILQDSCDAEQFLKCQNMRCVCQDPANQIFQPKEYLKPADGSSSRAKRSPKRVKYPWVRQRRWESGLES